MTGGELKKAIKDAGFTISEFAEMLGMSQQNLSARLSRKSVRADFAERVIMTIHEKGNKMIGLQNAIGEHITQKIYKDQSSLRRENELLRQQLEWLKTHNSQLLEILKEKSNPK